MGQWVDKHASAEARRADAHAAGLVVRRKHPVFALDARGVWGGQNAYTRPRPHRARRHGSMGSGEGGHGKEAVGIWGAMEV